MSESYRERKYGTWQEPTRAHVESDEEAETAGRDHERATPSDLIEDDHAVLSLSDSESDRSEYEYDPERYVYYYTTAEPEVEVVNHHKVTMRDEDRLGPRYIAGESEEEVDEKEKERRAKLREERVNAMERMRMKLISYQLVVTVIIAEVVLNGALYVMFFQYWESSKDLITWALLLCQVLTMACYTVTIMSDPGYVSQGGGLDTETLSEDEKKRHCSDCNIVRPDRVFHCFYCNRCVERLDHHSPVANNCIGTLCFLLLFLIIFIVGVHFTTGKKNTRSYLLFLIMAFTNLLVLAFGLLVDVPWISGQALSGPKHLFFIPRILWLYVLLLLMMVPWLFAMVLLLIRHGINIGLGMTIFEQTHWNEIDYIQYNPFRNKYDHGVQSNCARFWLGDHDDELAPHMLGKDPIEIAAFDETNIFQSDYDDSSRDLSVALG